MDISNVRADNGKKICNVFLTPMFDPQSTSENKANSDIAAIPARLVRELASLRFDSRNAVRQELAREFGLPEKTKLFILKKKEGCATPERTTNDERTREVVFDAAIYHESPLGIRWPGLFMRRSMQPWEAGYIPVQLKLDLDTGKRTVTIGGNSSSPYRLAKTLEVEELRGMKKRVLEELLDWGLRFPSVSADFLRYTADEGCKKDQAERCLL